MQTTHLPLCKAQGALDLLSNKIRNGRSRQSSKSHSCKLKCDKINANNNLSTDHFFETRVAKIQQGVAHENQMSPEERNACKMLLKTNDVMSDDETQSDDDDVELDITIAIENQEKRKALEMEGQSKMLIATSQWAVPLLWSNYGVKPDARTLQDAW